MPFNAAFDTVQCSSMCDARLAGFSDAFEQFVGDFIAGVFLAKMSGAFDGIKRGAGDHISPLLAPGRGEDRVTRTEDDVHGFCHCFNASNAAA